jgi:hypothetical protein
MLTPKTLSAKEYMATKTWYGLLSWKITATILTVIMKLNRTLKSEGIAKRENKCTFRSLYPGKMRAI